MGLLQPRFRNAKTCACRGRKAKGKSHGMRSRDLVVSWSEAWKDCEEARHSASHVRGWNVVAWFHEVQVQFGCGLVVIFESFDEVALLRNYEVAEPEPAVPTCVVLCGIVWHGLPCQKPRFWTLMTKAHRIRLQSTWRLQVESNIAGCSPVCRTESTDTDGTVVFYIHTCNHFIPCACQE